jgi:hypothetical protein
MDPTTAQQRFEPPDRMRFLETDPPASVDAAADTEPDPGLVVLTCANCGAPMDERKCKLICRCGYFLSCSDYY